MYLTFSFLGIYSFYRGVLELTSSKTGINFQVHKIVLALILLLIVNSIGNSIVRVAWADNTSETITSVFDGVLDFLTHILDRQDDIFEFMERWNNFTRLPMVASPSIPLPVYPDETMRG